MIWNSVKVDNKLYIDRFYSFFEKDCEPSYDFKGESHNFWECVYVTGGTVCVTADERVYNMKMRKAVEMLKNGANVTEVSMHLGFCSQPYFTSAFKRELGITPSDVRKFH